MNYSVCLDPSSFDLTSLSANGFSVYTDLDNFTTPIIQNIPSSLLFPPPTGTCPYTLSGIPNGATQLLIIDQCDGAGKPTKAFIPPSEDPAPTTDCCYAIINIASSPSVTSSFCATCSLDFDVFSSSYVGQIVAGNLTSTCGSVTDYTIGWYLNGDYSAPELISGTGSAFIPYQFSHPLSGNSSVPALAGNWEGIIHDISINGVVYSSVSGSANGILIPFESCFDTVVVEPLECDNGGASGKYSHQLSFNSQAVGTTPAPVSLTYTLSSTTKHFAYAFGGLNVWDELEIKFKSGNPNATSNPSLYSQPIYLEKIRVGLDAQNTINNYQLYESTYSLPGSYPSSNFDGQYSNVNNTWPKYSQYNGFSQRVLTLTTLETSSNPSSPDLLEITITPNPTNNNTQWYAGFQCLTDFDCTDCMFTNYPNNLPKIWKLELDKIYGCDAQKLFIYRTGSCDSNTTTSDWMGNNIGNYGLPGLSNPSINLINANNQYYSGKQFPATSAPYNNTYLSLKGATTCTIIGTGGGFCGPSSTGSITFTQVPNQIQLTFNTYGDYIYYKNSFLAQNPGFTTPVTCSAGSTSINYYKFFTIGIPVQGINANCGDNTVNHTAYFHLNDYFNIQYVENPSSNFWSITIPQTSMVNCYPQLPCDNCNTVAQQFINIYNSNYLQSFSFTTNTGAKLQTPVGFQALIKSVGGGVSGSYCNTIPNDIWSYVGYAEAVYYPWYSTHTLPFISSSNGWVNLTSLGTTALCSDKTGSYPLELNHSSLGLCYAAKISGYSVRFPHLTSSGFNYSLSTNDFEIYAEAGYGLTGSVHATEGVQPAPCFDPSSSLIYRYSGSTATVITSSHFWNGVAPTLIIDP
jgi:hypothetical protein